MPRITCSHTLVSRKSMPEESPGWRTNARSQTWKAILAFVFICYSTIAGCDSPFSSNHDDTDDFVLIDEKLQIQFALYEEAQEKAVQRVAELGGWIERNEWESWLTPASGDALTDDELRQLTERQETTVRESRADALQAVELDLDLIRNNEEALDRYCMEFPKGGMLHIHPSGTRNRRTVREILETVNPVINGPEILLDANDGDLSILYPDEIDYLANLPVLNYLDYGDEDQRSILDFFFLPENPSTHDFKRFEAIFTINDLLEQDPSMQEWVEEKTYLDFLERCAAQNISYIEFTRVMWPDPLTFEQLQPWAEAWYQKTGVRVRWNSAFIRTLDFDANTEWTQGLLDILEVGSYPELVGIDLLANETDTPALETGQNIYLPILAANRQGLLHLHRTMHAGELGDIRNVRDAMIMGVERVGHGVLLAQDPIALEYAVREKNLPIVINLYSNYRLQVNVDFSKHPFINYLRLGLPVSFATDDEGMFVTDIVNEYKIAIRNTDITHGELKQMAYNSIETAFCDDTLKTDLLLKLTRDLERFEEKWRQELTRIGLFSARNR